jgi:hypothetical protein
MLIARRHHRAGGYHLRDAGAAGPGAPYGACRPGLPLDCGQLIRRREEDAAGWEDLSRHRCSRTPAEVANQVGHSA